MRERIAIAKGDRVRLPDGADLSVTGVDVLSDRTFLTGYACYPDGKHGWRFLVNADTAELIYDASTGITYNAMMPLGEALDALNEGGQ